jgi:hypothetical protein
MKGPTLKSLAPFACAVALCTAPFANLHASDPYTVFLDPDPSVYTGFWDITFSPQGNLYGVGFGSVDEEFNDLYTLVVRSPDRGATWEKLISTPEDPSNFLKAAVDGAGNLYALSGYAHEASLWRSNAAEAAAHLQPLIKFFEAFPGFRVTWKGMAVDAAGNVFVCGYRPVTTTTKPTTTFNRWMVIKGIPTSSGGLAWSVVDEFVFDAKYGSFATGLAIRPSNNPSSPSEVWVRGTVGSKSGNQVALRRSTNGGAVGSWQTVTTYAGDTRWIRGIGADSLAVGVNGEVYDVGQVAVSVSKKAVENRWTTWRLAPGSTTVAIVDQLSVSSGAAKVGVDSTGRVYVHGGRSGFDGSVLRTSANGNAATWGDYDLAAGASFYAMTIDDEGSVYLAGECVDPATGAWLGGCIRKLPAP